MVVVVEVVGAGAAEAAAASAAVGPFSTSHSQHQNCIYVQVRMLVGHVQLSTQNMFESHYLSLATRHGSCTETC